MIPDHLRPPDKYVYFLSAPSLGVVKIGCSSAPRKRLMALYMMLPVPIEMLLRVPGNHADEWHIHWTFRAQRSHGEWFWSSPALEKMIDELRAGATLSTILGPAPSWKDRRRIRRAEPAA